MGISRRLLGFTLQGRDRAVAQKPGTYQAGRLERVILAPVAPGGESHAVFGRARLVVDQPVRPLGQRTANPLDVGGKLFVSVFAGASSHVPAPFGPHQLMG